MSPRATYRVQFHKGFTFADAAALAPYFAELGISHLYASPILTARTGSMHGYDVIDPARVNPELGCEDGFRALAATLRQQGLGIILDIVPNHMAVGGADNPYWLDLLEKGRDSVFANLFDIDWEPAQPSLRDKVLVPFLGKKPAEALEAGDIALIWDTALGKFAFAYAEHRFPLRPEDYEEVAGGAEKPELAMLARFNEPAALRDLLARQNFRLAFWQDAGERINWRRFFDITGLAALRIEDDGVFELVHATMFRLYAEGLIDGLRIDHVDGLADPKAYCRRLRARLEALLPQRERKERPYIVVEKILAPDEALPADWGVDGTTGYDFMSLVSALQHNGANAGRFAKAWAEISGRAAEFETEERAARREILSDAFVNALRAAAAAFHAVDGDTSQGAFEQALTLLLEHFRAYRTYATGDSVDPPPGEAFDKAIAFACDGAEDALRSALTSIAATMRGERAASAEAAREAARRFNQLAAPVAAKAVEDTAFYRYGRLLSRNDVGFAPGVFSRSREDFFANLSERRTGWPQGLLATATHDHKRGEDVRARLAALSELPQLWQDEVRAWRDLNAGLRDGAVTPGDEYQLYQTLAGCWPPGLHSDAAGALAEFAGRILAWREKSLREAKLQTSWVAPDAAFEKANADFVRAILDPTKSAAFLSRLAGFVERLAPVGFCNSLAQCALRCTAPGVPDLYQGTELWDFSLVDPDNRRPVDYAARRALLARDAVPAFEDWTSGAVKLALIRRLLALRASMPECFAAGDFQPVETDGPRAGNIVAFVRTANERSVLVAVPRLCAQACLDAATPLPDPSFWRGSALVMPTSLHGKQWRNVLDPQMPGALRLDCGALFATFPVAVFASQS